MPETSSMKGFGFLVMVIFSFDASSSGRSGVEDEVIGTAAVPTSVVSVRLWTAIDDATADSVRDCWIADGGDIVYEW